MTSMTLFLWMCILHAAFMALGNGALLISDDEEERSVQRRSLRLVLLFVELALIVAAIGFLVRGAS